MVNRVVRVARRQIVARQQLVEVERRNWPRFQNVGLLTRVFCPATARHAFARFSRTYLNMVSAPAVLPASVLTVSTTMTLGASIRTLRIVCLLSRAFSAPFRI